MTSITESIKKSKNLAKEALEVAEYIMAVKKELTAVMAKNRVLEERSRHKDEKIKSLKKRLMDIPTVEQLQQENEILRQRINQLNEHIQWQQQTTTTN